MDEYAEQFVAVLAELTSDGVVDTSLLDELYAAVDLLEDSATVTEVFPAIFDVFETYPAADLGMPGPLVHLVEKSPTKEYEELLLESLARKPVHHTVWMANRILNSSETDDSVRSRLLSVIEEAVTHSAADELAREVAADFLERQRSLL